MSTSPPSADRESAPAAPRPARRAAVLTLILATLTATGPLATDLYLPAFPAIAADLGAPEAQIQLTLTAMMVGLAVGQLAIGPMSDAWGRRRPLLVGVTVFALVSVAIMVAPDAQTFIALRFVQGLAGAAGAVIARAVVRDLFTGDDAARFFSRLMLVTGIAPLVGPVLGGQLLLVGPWQLSFGVLAAVSAVALVVVGVWLPESLPRHQRTPLRPRVLVATVGRLVRDRAYLGPVLTLGLAFGTMFTYIGAFSTVAQGELGVTAQQYSVMFAVVSLGLMIGNFGNGRLIGRVDTVHRLAGGLVGVAVAVVGLAVAVAFQPEGLGGLVLLGGVLSVMMFSLGFVYPNATTLALSSQPVSVAGSASALMGALQFTLGGGLAALAGLTPSGQATLASMAVVMGIGILAAGAAFTLSRRKALAV
ncbi:multidrug effflux MFS transporter [Nocardiopsis coralliicola]